MLWFPDTDRLKTDSDMLGIETRLNPDFSPREMGRSKGEFAPSRRMTPKMSFRFHKRIKIVPRLNMNLSKGWPSLSIGGRGATINLARLGSRTTFGVPGTGMSCNSPVTHTLTRPFRHNRISKPSTRKGQSKPCRLKRKSSE
jgi:hypothetical protein